MAVLGRGRGGHSPTPSSAPGPSPSFVTTRVLAIAILYVCLSHGWISQKAVQARITKSPPSAAWRTLVSETVKLFHKFEGVTANEVAK